MMADKHDGESDQEGSQESSQEGSQGCSQGGSQKGSQEFLLTADTVATNLKHGWFQLKFDKSKNASSAYDVIQKVHYRDNDGGEHVKPWFKCSRCGILICHDTSTGTQPLIRHKEQRCDALTKDDKMRYAASKSTKPTKAAKMEEVVVANNTSIYMIDEEEIIHLIAKIGNFTEAAVKAVLPDPQDKNW